MASFWSTKNQVCANSTHILSCERDDLRRKASNFSRQCKNRFLHLWFHWPTQIWPEPFVTLVCWDLAQRMHEVLATPQETKRKFKQDNLDITDHLVLYNLIAGQDYIWCLSFVFSKLTDLLPKRRQIFDFQCEVENHLRIISFTAWVFVYFSLDVVT